MIEVVPVWIDDQGEHEIAKMSTDVIRKALDQMREAGVALREARLEQARLMESMVHGDMASWFAAQDVRRLEEDSLDEFMAQESPTFSALLDEYENRSDREA